MRGLLCAALAVGCAGGPPVLARGSLAYDVAAAGDLVASVELETEFALVLRRAGKATRVTLGPPEHDFVALDVDAAGRVAAVAGLDGTVRLHDAVTGRERARWRLDAPATAVAISRDGTLVATGAASGVLCLRRVDDGALLHCVAEHSRRITALAAGKELLVSADAGGALVVWTLPALRVVQRRHEDTPIAAIALSADEKRVALAGPPVTAVAFAGDRVATAEKGRVRIGERAIDGFPGELRGLATAGGWLYVAGFTGADLRGASITALRLP